MSKAFKLSAVLFGHSLDVRSVYTLPDNSIISGSRDKTAKFWRANGFNAGYTESVTYKDQKNFVAAVLYLKPSNEYPDGLVVTGGNDNVILIYKPNEPFATFTINEHTNAVCCLAAGLEANTFLSGSWDTTAKFWTVNSSASHQVTYTGHTAAIWSVLQLSNGCVATASADKFIGIWTREGQKIKFLSGHKDCVRDLADFPEFNQFISVSNDASIKVWTYNGENVDTLYGHTNYIYSIARNLIDGPNTFVTCDEDRTIRYWKDGTNTQSITLPAQSIWSVACLSNGDIVSGSSDGVIRIFTQNETRFASEEALKQFEEEVEAVQKQACQEIGGYKVSDLPGKEALYDPGKNPGQMKMIREGTSVIAYTWVEDGDNSHWEKVGDVVGANDKANEGKTMFEGKGYDFVFTVDVEDGKPPLKLPYNKGDDVYVAATKFLSKNDLPSTYMDEVVDFINRNTQGSGPTVDNNYVDPFTGASRYRPPESNNASDLSAGMNFDPLTGGSSYSTSQSQNRPSSSVTSGANVDPFTAGNSYSSQKVDATAYFPHKNYIRFDMGDPKVILNKLKEFNQKVGDDGNKVNESMINDVVKLCDEPCTNGEVLDVLFKMLQWPSSIVFPAIDVVRLAVRDEVNNGLIATTNNGAVLESLKPCVGGDCIVPNNTVVAFRALCNLFLYSTGEELIFNNRVEILEIVTTLNNLSNKNVEIGLATLLLNLTILMLKRKDEVGLILMSGIIPDLTMKMDDAEAQFRSFVALGTLLTSAEAYDQKEMRENILRSTSFISKLEQLSKIYGTDLELKRMRCAIQVQRTLMAV